MPAVYAHYRFGAKVSRKLPAVSDGLGFRGTFFHTKCNNRRNDMHAIEKIFAQHSGRDCVKTGEIITADVDFAEINDLYLQTIYSFREMGGTKVWDNEKAAFVFDHYAPAPDMKSAKNQGEMREFAKKNNLIVVSDAAYASLTFDGNAISILQVEGAKDVAVELHSLSKSHNMTGWRIGWVCGNPLIVKAYGDVKDNTDSGQFLGIQLAAAKGLENPNITRAIAAKYSRRMDMLVKVLQNLGFKPRKPNAGFFLYMPAPKAAILPDGSRVEFKTGEDFSQWMITEHLISTVPWDDAGAFVRFSVTFEAHGEDSEKAVIAEIDRRMSQSKFEF